MVHATDMEIAVQSQDRGQVSRSAADVYQEFFVPALFGQWAGPVCDAARIVPGENILDVACGTGVVTVEAERRVGPTGKVTGLDINPGMLDAARRKSSAIIWREANVQDIPFPDGSFDAVTCQFGLMFFDDRAAALAEMWRVLAPNGRLALAIWDKLENTPGYAAVVELLERLFEPAIATGMRAPFVLGDVKELTAIFAAAGVPNPRVETLDGTARFSSIEAWVHTDIKGWTLADLIDDDQYATLLKQARQDLARFCLDDGSVAFASPAHIVAAVKA